MAGIAEAQLARLLASVTDRPPTPGGGTVIEVATALAAGLAEMTARYVPHASGGPAGAGPPRSRGTGPERSDAVSGQAATVSRRTPAGPHPAGTRRPPGRPARARATGDRAIDGPLETGRLALDLAEAGRLLALRGGPALRSDARAIVLLSSTIARCSAVLVHDALRSRPGDPRRDEAERCANAAEAIAGRLLGPPRVTGKRAAG